MIYVAPVFPPFQHEPSQQHGESTGRGRRAESFTLWWTHGGAVLQASMAQAPAEVGAAVADTDGSGGGGGGGARGGVLVSQERSARRPHLLFQR